jgi:hypothetical protein
MRLNSLQTKECSSSKSVSCRIGSTRNEKTYVYFSEPLSKSARHTHMAEELQRELTTSIVASSRIRRSTPPVFGRASQNVVAATMLLHNMPKPSNPEAH